jgi:single-stranded DNA-binding protein
MTEPSVSFAGNLTDDPELRHTESGIARAMFRVVVSGRREQEASFLTVIVWRDQAEHASQSLSKGSRVVVVGRLQQRGWTAEDGSVRSTSVPSCLRYRASLMGPLARPPIGSLRPTGGCLQMPSGSLADRSTSRHQAGETSGQTSHRGTHPDHRRKKFLYELKACPAARNPRGLVGWDEQGPVAGQCPRTPKKPP